MMQVSPKERAATVFNHVFGATPAFIATAPGRVNLIGEHTDYNDGFVLPVAINYYTAIAAAPRADNLLDVVADDEAGQRVQFSLDEPAQFDHRAPWSNYLRGVVAQLRVQGFRLAGANLAISGNVPLGAGLSSSAALEMATIAALTQISDESIDALTAARVGQAAENEFVGCQCGIMDQLISAAGQADSALLLDCRSLDYQLANMPSNTTLLVLNSNVRRALVDGEYNLRRQQCESSARHFGVPALRDITLQQLQAEEPRLDPVNYRRARHVVTENQRTLEAFQALTNNDLNSLALLMAESHRSMRDDFEITVPAIDDLVAIVKDVVGSAGGVRMTGGGFGGCVVALLPKALVQPAVDAVNQTYTTPEGQLASVYVCQASNGSFV